MIKDDINDYETEWHDEYKYLVPDSDKAPDLEKNPLQYLIYYRWVINFWLIGIPYFLFVVLSNGWNFVFNLNRNFAWAGGNVFLLANSVYSFVQSLLGLMIIFEIPVWLKHAKEIRGSSLMAAVTWNTFFLGFLYRARSTIKNSHREEFDFADFFEVLFIGYNLVMHGPIFLINLAIILKEIDFEFLQLMNDSISGDSDYALGLIHIYMFFRNVFFVLNPLNWLDVIYYMIYGSARK